MRPGAETGARVEHRFRRQAQPREIRAVDLHQPRVETGAPPHEALGRRDRIGGIAGLATQRAALVHAYAERITGGFDADPRPHGFWPDMRSEEPRAGNKCVSTFRSGWSSSL